MRNNVISICKGIAIILMVIGHAEVPDLLSNFIYVFHMPLFFIAAGYFFSRKNVDDPWGFCSRRMKGLYIPFLKWSLVFLLLHNLWFRVGLLNEQFGNWQGGVTHPYTAADFAARFMRIVTSMSGYDEFMAGAFWFFRGLLVASILFLVLYKLIDGRTRLSHVGIVVAICAAALAFQAFRLGNGLRIVTLPNGGLREIWGLFFFGIGVLYRRFEPTIGHRWWVALLCFGIIAYAATQHWCGMNNNGQLRDLLTLPVTGTAGFLMTKYIAELIDMRESIMRRLLVFVGSNTLYVFIFHIISFKAVSWLKIIWYGLEPEQIGCHMVIHYNNHEDLFWILYTIAGVGIPLLVLTAVRRAHASISARRAPVAATPLPEAEAIPVSVEDPEPVPVPVEDEPEVAPAPEAVED